MPRRVPSDATVGERLAWDAIWDEINKLKVQNTDLKGRRFVNAGKAVAQSDLITRGQVQSLISDAVSSLQTTTNKKIKKATGVSSSGGSSGGGTTGPGLPTATHPMDFGYYFVDSRYGQFESEVSNYTNLAYIGPNNMLDSSATQSDVKAALTLGAARLAAAGLYMVLDLERGSLLTAGGALEAVSAYWPKVKYVVVNGSWGDTKDALNAEIVADRQRINNLGLEPRPMGCVLEIVPGPTPDWVNASELDFVMIEAYSADPGNHGTSAQNIAAVSDYIARIKAAIPANKSLAVIYQAYDRNGAFAPITPDLVDLQNATYRLCYNDQRVAFMLLFSYGRNAIVGGVEIGGTKTHPELKVPHQAIWNAIRGLGGSGINPGGGGGGGGAGATDCGQGRPCCGGVTGVGCPRWCSGGDLQQAFFTSQGAYIAGAPAAVIDPTNSNHILDITAYMNGIVTQFNADNPTLVAVIDALDAHQIAAKKKGDTTQSEHYKVFSGGGDASYVRYLYAATCYPAKFVG